MFMSKFSTMQNELVKTVTWQHFKRYLQLKKYLKSTALSESNHITL